ncbi:hypothetical protein [Blastopirellula marina]|uniref:Uncharacterized protein n=1 Tax=Blastopirellula marina DSM 3645 TaxID=314230 RepID=A3ZXQ5_9BACT|nr:hypothetical protein [Blastopirellula marina]EAQ78597.1 hypothetical protein DSM3645_07390 [Blastopirellula marina DSM 3645]
MKKMFLLALMAALMAGFATTNAMAERDAGAKARGDFGHGFWNTQVHRPMRVMNYTRVAPQPAAVQTPAPPTVTKAAEQPAAVAQTDNSGVTQRFSYEPTETVNNYQPVRNYQSVQTHHKSPWQYPKTDARRYHR